METRKAQKRKIGKNGKRTQERRRARKRNRRTSKERKSRSRGGTGAGIRRGEDGLRRKRRKE